MDACPGATHWVTQAMEVLVFSRVESQQVDGRNRPWRRRGTAPEEPACAEHAFELALVCYPACVHCRAHLDLVAIRILVERVVEIVEHEQPTRWYQLTKHREVALTPAAL